ncbi:MAG: phage virion morphogenesis protein [Acidobacteriota bacterium]|nr:phage virion morphogenesis protein [Acidobacteriota bacterium]
MAEFIRGINEVISRVRRFQQRAATLDKPVSKGGDVMLKSIKTNFDVGGRPAFQALAASTLRSKKGSSILVEDGTLRDSFEKSPQGNKIEVGTNDIKARRHHHGYSKPGGGRGHSTTPARPYVLFQPEDITEIGGLFRRHVIL